MTSQALAQLKTPARMAFSWKGERATGALYFRTAGCLTPPLMEALATGSAWMIFLQENGLR